MARTLKTALLAIVALLAVFVAVRMLMHRGAASKPEGKEAAQEAYQGPGPFDGTGVRFDGHYLCERGNLRYLIRFFPEGRVVLVNGTKEVEATLPAFLIRETKGDPSIGLHNVMATARGDSIFFVTKPLRGEISYRGRVVAPSLVRFFRHSHITGVDSEMEYRFVQDSASAQQPS